MSHSLLQTEGGTAAQTVTLNKPAAGKPCKQARRLTVGYHSTDKPGVDVPHVRLCGRWLQDAGFVIGRHVTVEVSEGRLTIEQTD